MNLPLGPFVADIQGLALDSDDRRRLLHPMTGGVILFARNFESGDQLQALTAEIRSLRSPALPICVDHEGGRVQRFRTGFTAVPPMRSLGRLWDADRAAAVRAAESVGVVIAAELSVHGVDFSFTPVLDLDYGASSVIGDRALHAMPEAVGALGAAIVRGLWVGGMPAVGKHFPGHGYATADSHVAIPTDERGIEEIMALDVAPYRPAIAAGLAAVMPAHLIYTQVDPDPAGFSRYWLQDVLRRQLGFDGVIFSDDLSMEGASTAGGVKQRADAAFAAGCDAILLCNSPQASDELLAAFDGAVPAAPRMPRMARDPARSVSLTSEVYRAALRDLARLG